MSMNQKCMVPYHDVIVNGVVDSSKMKNYQHVLPPIGCKENQRVKLFVSVIIIDNNKD
jgi:hypothetical protein